MQPKVNKWIVFVTINSAARLPTWVKIASGSWLVGISYPGPPSAAARPRRRRSGSKRNAQVRRPASGGASRDRLGSRCWPRGSSQRPPQRFPRAPDCGLRTPVLSLPYEAAVKTPENLHRPPGRRVDARPRGPAGPRGPASRRPEPASLRPRLGNRFGAWPVEDQPPLGRSLHR